MSDEVPNTRRPGAEVDSLFPGRWSPRSFDATPLTDAQVASLFEAARWAPSAGNSQPWLFLYETDGPDRELFNSILSDRNRRWASRAPLLGFIAARKQADNGRVLRTSQFDTGAAWISLALQARTMGLYAHAMAGIDRDAAYEKLNVPREEYEVICGFVAGRRADPDTLPDDLREREKPNDRKPSSEFAHRGRFGG